MAINESNPVAPATSDRLDRGNNGFALEDFGRCMTISRWEVWQF
ncbi:MAG: hypothetical protein AAF892_16630 [Cyanobacteria bacterium P01_D01_bin.71]